MSPPHPPQPPLPLHVVLVDDDARQREQTQSWLESAGYRVSPCSGLGDFERLVAATPPDLILIDVLMPAFGAADLERLLRHFPATSSSPVVLHSPLPAATLRRLVKTSGALGILEATLTREAFVAAFRAFAETLLLRHRLRAANSGTHRIGSGSAEQNGAQGRDTRSRNSR
ncbi:MAG TPA: response regulator [Polyangiaceae bacterium]|nr:response regulator [Polyangiaceae bacterium]